MPVFGTLNQTKTRVPTCVRSHLEKSVQAWGSYLLGDIDKLDKVQRRATKSVRSLENYTYEERLKILKLLTLKQDTKRRFDKVFKIV